MRKKEFKCLYKIDEKEKLELQKKYFYVEPMICGCNDFVMRLRSDGSVVAHGIHDFTGAEAEKWNDIIKLSAGNRHIVGLRNDGTVVAIGDNTYGQCDVYDWKLN